MNEYPGWYMMRSGIILAGGRSTRFGGGEKSLRQVNGKAMICRVMESLRGVVDEIIISVRDEKQQELVYPIIRDIDNFVYDESHGMGPLSGVRSGLRKARGDYVIIVACDMPYIKKEAVELLFGLAMGHDAAVPMHEDGFIEPLHAVYKRDAMLDAVEHSFKAGEKRIASPLKYLGDVVYVTDEKIKAVDPALRTFLNINKAEDLSL